MCLKKMDSNLSCFDSVKVLEHVKYIVWKYSYRTGYASFELVSLMNMNDKRNIICHKG